MQLTGLGIAIHAGQVILCNTDGMELCGLSPDAAEILAKQMINAASQIRTGTIILPGKENQPKKL